MYPILLCTISWWCPESHWLFQRPLCIESKISDPWHHETMISYLNYKCQLHVQLYEPSGSWFRFFGSFSYFILGLSTSEFICQPFVNFYGICQHLLVSRKVVFISTELDIPLLIFSLGHGQRCWIKLLPGPIPIDLSLEKSLLFNIPCLSSMHLQSPC